MTVVYVEVQIVYFAVMFKHLNVNWKKYVLNVISSIVLILAFSEGVRIIFYALHIVSTL